MDKRLRKAILIGATMAIVGLGTPVFAQTSGAGIEPEVFAGDVACDTPDILAYCSLTNPIQMQAIPPRSAALKTFTTLETRPAFGTAAVQFVVTLDAVTSSKFNYTDKSLNGLSTVSEQADTPGLDCVIVRSGSKANVYRRVNLVRDTNLGAPDGANIGQITFCWTEGPCKETQATVSAICALWNQPDGTTEFPEGTSEADIVQGHSSTQTVNLCGCTSPVRNCDQNVSDPAQGGCFAPGAGIVSLDTQASATAAEGTTAPAALGFSALAATTTCPAGTCPYYTRIGGGTTTSCVLESTADSDAVCK